ENPPGKGRRPPAQSPNSAKRLSICPDAAYSGARLVCLGGVLSGKNGEAKHPSQFMACWELREMLGRRAADVQELLDGLEEVPLDSIYFHTHSYFLRHPYIAGPYPNDFANWTAIQLRDRVLGERLAVIDPFEVSDVEALRNELVTILDDHLSHVGSVPRVVYGELFFFMQS